MSTKKKGFSCGALLMPDRMGTCHRMINILVSSVCGTGMLVGAAIALDEAPSSPEPSIQKSQELYAITATGVFVTVIQLFLCIPYAVINHKKGGKYMHYIFAIYHIFVSAASLILFFLAFYLVETHSFDLRKNFWAQFKFKVEKVSAYMGAFITFADFAGLNAALAFLIVIFPGVSKVWNRNNDNVQIPLS